MCFWIVNGILISATKSEIEKIASRSEVQLVSPNYPVSLIAPVSEAISSSKTGGIDYFQATGARELWKMGYTGKGRLVCGFDTGVEWTHPALFHNWKGGLQEDEHIGIGDALPHVFDVGVLLRDVAAGDLK